MAREDAAMRTFVIWMLLSVYGVSSLHDPPKINPSKSEIVVNGDDEINLECWSPHGPVTWNANPRPEALDNEEDHGFQITTEESGKNYYAKLTVKKAQYFHTGAYRCEYNVDEDPNFDSFSEIYVYAFDEENLLVTPGDFDPITVQPDHEATVPCRATSPKVNMTLWDSQGNQMVVDGNEISYNPRVGFTLLHPPRDQVECRAQLGNAEPCADCTAEFIIHVLARNTDIVVPKPVISGDNHAVMNTMFTLTCKVYHEHRGALNIKWLDPRNEVVRNDPKDRVFVGNHETIIENNAEYVGLTLTVASASRADNGTYRCEAQNGQGNKTSAEIGVHILEEGQSFINLEVQGNKTTIQANEGTNALVQWIVDIHAHPKATVSWRAHNDNIIPISKILHPAAINGSTSCDSSTDYRYWSTTTETKTKLTICKPKVSDTGIFTLEVRNSFGASKTLELFLNVSGSPEVYLRPYNLYPLHGDLMNLSCTVSSNPKSRVRWIYYECNFEPGEDCLSREPQQLVNATELEELNTVVHSSVSLVALKTGIIFCKACNRNVSSNDEVCNSARGDVIVSDMPDGFGLKSPKKIIEGDEQVNISCMASRPVYNDSLQWLQISPEERDAAAVPGVSVFLWETPRSYVTDIQIHNASISHSGTYQCVGQRKDVFRTDRREVTIEVIPMAPPVIRESSFNQTKKEVPVGFEFTLWCRAFGTPEPKIEWYKDHRQIQVPSDRRIKLLDQNRKLVVRTIASDEGTYECRAVNRRGQDSRSIKIVLSHDVSVYVYIGVALLALVLILVIVYLVIRIKKEKKQRKRLMKAGLLDFEKGAVENLDPNIPVDEQAERLPYDPDFEFPRNKLILGKVLGSGAFGVVLKGDAYGILREDEVTPVAVKTVKKNADGSILRALTSELKILIHLGRHLNVVNLLGACTKCINKMELLVIVEYCRYGNLHNYLLRHRKVFVNQVDPTTGQIDYSIKSRHAGDRRLKYATLSFNSSSQSNSMGDDMRDYRSDYGENLVSGATDVTTVSMTPTGAHEESSLMSNNSNQPEWRSNYTGDYKDNVDPITTEDLVCFAFQVARGMDYLASRKVLHGDLAARNILLADNKVVKICDFGLARTMYKDETYRKKENGPLPIKWMAIESLRDLVFSTQSDVWSFGIVLWEFFTLSRTPYPGAEPNQKFLERLEEGHRMEKPPYAPEEVYDLMMSCWRARPTLRPSFSELADKLGALLNEDLRNLYIEMNRPYIEKNTAWMEGPGRQDYLAMMNAPVYDNMTSPLPVDDDPRISSPIPVTPGSAGFPSVMQDGYVVMRSPVNSNDPRNIFSPTRIPSSNGGSVFKFCPPPRTLSSPEEEHIELRPMLSGGGSSHRSESATESDTDAYLEPRNNRPITLHPSKNKFSFEPGETVVDSLSNPSYLMAPTINTSKDNYINYPQPIDSKLGGNFWHQQPHQQPHQQRQQPQQEQSKLSLGLSRPDHFIRPGDMGPVQDVILPPSYINIPSQRRGFALPNNDEVTYANFK